MVVGAANDNMVKTAFVVAVSVLNWELLGITPIMLANLAALCFIALLYFWPVMLLILHRQYDHDFG